MPLKRLTTTSTVFDIESITPGDLLALWDSDRRLIGTGVVIEVTQLDITCAIRTGDERFEETTTRYRIDLEKVIEGLLIPIVIKPSELSLENDQLGNLWEVKEDAWR